MFAIAGGILIVLAILATGGFALEMMDERPGCGCSLLVALVLFVLIYIF